MKNLCSFAAISLLFGNSFLVNAQHIPDPVFAAAIANTCYSCIDASNNLTTDAQTLTVLNVSGYITDLTGLDGFTNLQTFSCYGNDSISVFPALPPNLVYFSSQQTHLASLPALPSTLETVICSHNSIASLPALPSSLITLNCEENQLTSLPNLPSSLIILRCGWNHLTSFPSLPDSLQEITFEGNQISAFPSFPTSIKTINCDGNNI